MAIADAVLEGGKIGLVQIGLGRVDIEPMPLRLRAAVDA